MILYNSLEFSITSSLYEYIFSSKLYILITFFDLTDTFALRGIHTSDIIFSSGIFSTLCYVLT